jgi:hypothetical protein
VLPKRAGQNEEPLEKPNGNTLVVAEAARAAAQPPPREGKPEEEKVSLFWRIFGGTILSMVTLGVITLYNGLSSNISELRADLAREREARADLVKKDEFSARSTSLYERIRAHDALKVELEGLKERAGANAAGVEALKKDYAAALDALRKDVTATTDAAKRDALALDLVKERVLALEAVRKDLAGLDAIKEKLANAVADLKGVRDDVNKFQQEVERNKAADLERKTARDAQYKQIDDAIKELQRGLQDCREKLARLEGAQPSSGTVPARGFFPAAPGEAKGPGATGAGRPAGKPGPDGGN